MGELKTFPWSPLLGAKSTCKTKVKKAKFGDGYVQRKPDGINSLSDVYSVSFEYDIEEIDLIDDFLRQHAGVKAFLYVPSSNHRKTRVICESWSRRRHTTKLSKAIIDAKFEEVPL